MSPTDSRAPIDDFGTNAPKTTLYLDVDGVLLGQGQRRVDAAELFEFARAYGKPVGFFDPDA